PHGFLGGAAGEGEDVVRVGFAGRPELRAEERGECARDRRRTQRVDDVEAAHHYDAASSSKKCALVARAVSCGRHAKSARSREARPGRSDHRPVKTTRSATLLCCAAQTREAT